MINVYTATKGRANQSDVIAKFAGVKAALAFKDRIVKEGKVLSDGVVVDPVDDGKRITEWCAWGF